MSELDKTVLPTKLLWVDLEMTGLDVQNDVILEVAAIVTDFDFNTLATYEAIVQQPADVVAARMQESAWWQLYPENRDAFIAKTSDGTSAKPSEQVEAELIQLIAEQFGEEPAILAGNSIHNDRNFVKQWWPQLDEKLHYRMLDVSAWKVCMQGKYGMDFAKKNMHRALDDIQESIAELQYYIDWFQTNRQA